VQPIEARLQAALSRLRRQCATITSTSDDRRKGPKIVLTKPVIRLNDMSGRLSEYQNREAIQQERIDGLQSEKIKLQYRIAELESLVDEWREKYHEMVRKTSKARRKEMATPLDKETLSPVVADVEQDLPKTDSSRFNPIIQSPSFECLALSPPRKLESPLRDGTLPQRPVYTFTLNSFNIPDLSRVFRPFRDSKSNPDTS